MPRLEWCRLHSRFFLARLIADTLLRLLPEHRFASEELANRIASATIGCRGDSSSGGSLVTLQRGNDWSSHAVAAQKKALTALSTKSSTRQPSECISADSAARNLSTIDALLLRGGGLPAIFEDEAAGAVRVAGAGGSAQDEACAAKVIGIGMTRRASDSPTHRIALFRVPQSGQFRRSRNDLASKNRQASDRRLNDTLMFKHNPR